MFNPKTVEKDYNFYVEFFLHSMRKIQKQGNDIDSVKHFERDKIKHVIKEVRSKFNDTIKSYPSVDQLPIIYQKMFSLYFSLDELKKELFNLKWIADKTEELGSGYMGKIKYARRMGDIDDLKKQFYGRFSSLFKRRKKTFETLAKFGYILRTSPTFKENKETFAICGYPNVGKSTLLKKMTGSNVDIQPYPFTTKNLMVGQTKDKQFIDTPGLFERPFEEMTIYEKISVYCLEYLADKIIFVLDLTESCGYTIAEQISLLKTIKKQFGKNMVIYLSKLDLMEDENKIDMSFLKELSEPKPDIIKNFQELL